MKIAIDVMGGDNAPLAPIQGGVLAAKAYGEEIVLVGPEERIRSILKEQGAENTPGISIVHAPDVVDMHDDPATVLRQKPESSMAVALKLVKNGEADAIVSAGSTGALLSGATLICKRIKGIRRAALAPVMPCAGGQVMLVDAGANTECTAEYLLQFAYLGSPLGKSMIQIKFRKTMFWAWQVTLSNFQSSAFGAVYQYHSDGR